MSEAQVAGLVTDFSGAAITGAQIRITEMDTKLARATTTDDQGRYVLPHLPVGPYELVVTANGFKNYTQSGIVLQVGNDVAVNVIMEVGSITDSVKVTAGAEMVQTAENDISQVIDQARIMDLPLDGRQPTQLITLAGAATPAPNGGIISSRVFYSTINISVAGNEETGTNYLLDGGDNTQRMWNVNQPFPFPDALQESSVDTSGVPVRYGSLPGGAVNAVTRSGTDDWHGDLFEFLRNGDTNARNFFAATHDTLKRNQFGGTVGSKIIRDKLFFFGGFQGTFNRQNPPSSIAYVPTPAILNNGDFSTFDGPLCTSNGAYKQLTDPTTGLPFPNDQIPVSRLSPQALNFEKYLPPAQNVCGKVTFGVPFTGDEDQAIRRVDWVQSSKHILFARYFLDNWRNAPSYNAADILQNSAGVPVQAQTFVLLIAALAQKHKLFLCVQDLTCPGASLIESVGLAAHVPGVAAIEANARQYVPAANRGWDKKYPGVFITQDGYVRCGGLNGPGLGFL